MDTQKERDKAVHELTRLKQHLLEKVSLFFTLFFEAESMMTEHDIQEPNSVPKVFLLCLSHKLSLI